MILETLPAMYDPVYAEFAEFVQALENGDFDQTDSPIQVMMNNHHDENDEHLEHMSTIAEEQPRRSANIEALYNIVRLIQYDMDFALAPPLTNKIRHDNIINARLAKYYSTGIQKYARHLRIIIDTLIQVDGWASERFLDYRRLERLVGENQGEVAEDYLVKLLSIARQGLPSDFQTIDSFVVDSNAVDPNKVHEG